MRRWTWLICGGLLLGSTTVASAESQDFYPPCTKTPTKGDQEAAEGAFKAGFGSYQEGDYSKAIMYWMDAYERDCTAHALLLNLANAHERMGDKQKAVHALEIYLKRAKEIPNRPTIERRVENLEAQIAAEAPAPEPKEDPAAKKPKDEPKPPPVEADDGVEGETSGGKSIVPWIVVGAGGVMTIVGGVVYLGGSSKVSDAEDVCPGRECPNTPEGQKALSDGDDGRSQMTVGGVLAGVGLAGVAGGLTWHFFFDNPDGGTDTAANKPMVQPTVRPDYAGVTVGGSF